MLRSRSRTSSDFWRNGYELREAILEGAAQISVPALVSTLCICIVFLPMFFLGGVARYLFVPLAEAVVFAMLASYILSRTLVPTLAMYLLRAKEHGAAARGIFARFQQGFERSLRTNTEAATMLFCRGWCCAARYSYRRFSVPVFLYFALVPIPRRGLLSQYRQRSIHSARARPVGDAYRRDCATVRPC